MRLGLLSTAKINDEILAGAAESELVDVVAVGSRDGERAQAYAAEHDVPKAHGSYEALLADDELDAIYISLPNGMHHEWTMHALAAGKHVLCEKPYSRIPEEVEEAFDAAEAAGLVLAEAFMYRHHPQTKELERLVREGAVGRLRSVHAVFSFPLTDLSNVRLDPELAGGALMDVGCYCISGCRIVAGDPVSVLAEQVVVDTGIDMATYGTMRFWDEVVGQFEASFLAPKRQSLEVVGAEGVLRASAPWRVDWGGELVLERNGEREAITVEHANSYRLELDNFAAAAAHETPSLLGRGDATAQARVIDALYRSAGEGASVSLAVEV